jgi:hypothetical protein
VLEAFLDLYRDILKRKLAGLSDERIRERHVPSSTTLGGLVKHLAAAEREWFQVVLAGGAEDDTPAAAGDGWTLRGGDSAKSLVQGYERACGGRAAEAGGSAASVAATRKVASWANHTCTGFLYKSMARRARPAKVAIGRTWLVGAAVRR